MQPSEITNWCAAVARHPSYAALKPALAAIQHYVANAEKAREGNRLFASNRELMDELSTRHRSLIIVAESAPEKKSDEGKVDPTFIFWRGSKVLALGLLEAGKMMLSRGQPDPEEEPWTSV